ncbi:MAG: polysaccharide deacetylase family protein, partial [Candidatus Heimdallarchaeaceae archaeon]
LEEHNIKATFFVLGWIAERVPKLVKEISKRGHEIASHGFGHLLNYNLTRKQLKEDLSKSKYLLEDVTGKPVIGYRAPSFSIENRVVEILEDIGYKYDSSLHDFSMNKRYGKLYNIQRKQKPFTIKGIIEFPLPVFDMYKLQIPISGGGYFRIMPFQLYMRFVMSYIHKHDYFLFYFHPWEFDSTQPRVKNVELIKRFKHYFGLNKAELKLRKLLSSFNHAAFSTINNVLRQEYRGSLYD